MSPYSPSRCLPALDLEELLEDQNDVLNNAKIGIHLGLEDSNVLIVSRKADQIQRQCLC